MLKRRLLFRRRFEPKRMRVLNTEKANQRTKRAGSGHELCSSVWVQAACILNVSSLLMNQMIYISSLLHGRNNIAYLRLTNILELCHSRTIITCNPVSQKLKYILVYVKEQQFAIFQTLPFVVQQNSTRCQTAEVMRPFTRALIIVHHEGNTSSIGR